MSNNKNLHSAKKEKNDEFYTQLSDIEKELKHYKEHFKDKIIYCNCDDPEQSNFYKYFQDNFDILGLKKLITSHYNPNGNSYKLEISRDINDKLNIKKTTFKGNGDFRSDECVEILKECDIVISNSPFSLFREYVAQLMEYDKKFLIIGNLNTITYKEVFKYIKENKIWLGNSFVKNFIKPNGEIQKFGNICWFTNLIYNKQREDLILTKKYTPEEYPKYDNYDAINVDKVKDIPMDYYGYMGVPITYLFKHTPEQFEIIKFRKGNDDKDLSIKGKNPYFRILIKKNYNSNQFEIVGQGQGNLYRELIDKGLSKEFVDNYYKNGGKGSIKENHPVLGYYDKDGKAVIPYMRIIIKRKPEQFEIVGLIASGYDPNIVGIPFKGEKEGRPLLNDKVLYARIVIKRK